jgi:outer membrane receptor protein involved in Fe transport
MPVRPFLLSLTLALAGIARPAAADPPPAGGTQLVMVTGHYLNAVGTSDAASEGAVTAKLIEDRPLLRPAEVLEFVPGLIVTQHSGDGKANQYYLRGFNLDHGTDFATFVDGMPVNMPTHAHGQGYSDLNWLIPELVERIDYRKGPYSAEDGDFASAGSARIRLAGDSAKPLAALTVGAHRYGRALLLDRAALDGSTLVYALEAAHDDGPWDHPEHFHRLTGMLRWVGGSDGTRAALTAMGYSAGWYATDQVPQRALDAGLIGRFGAVDPSDHGRTSRYSLSATLQRALPDGAIEANAYAIHSRLDLFSDFTYALDHQADPGGAQGDQFEQAEQRRVFGAGLRRRWSGEWAGRESSGSLGVQLRHDRLDPVGLYEAQAGQRTGVTQESRVRETSAAVYAQGSVQWTPWLRSVAGLRADRYAFDVSSSIAANSGRAGAGLVSPKLSLVFGPWQQTELFANAGEGFHSNDARGITETVTPKEGRPTAPVTPLVRTQGAELGLRTERLPGLQSSLALWQLRLGSELVFSGDAGDTEPSRPSERHGVEWSNHLVAARWLLLDADLAWSHARFTRHDAAGDLVPGSPDRVAALGATVTQAGPWSGQFELRYFGPRPLAEDGSVRSRSTTLASLRTGYRFGQGARLSLDVFNLFDRQASDIDYFYTSRLPGEPAAGVNDVHLHPAEPRTLRLTWAMPL